MKKNLIFLLLVTLSLASCKKDKKEEDNTVSLMGKWTIENTLIKEYVNGGVNTDTEPGNGTTMDFQDNGHVVITYADNSIESLSYSIKPDAKVEVDGDLFEIRNLTGVSVTLFLRLDYSPGEYDEVFINLKR